MGLRYPLTSFEASPDQMEWHGHRFMSDEPTKIIVSRRNIIASHEFNRSKKQGLLLMFLSMCTHKATALRHLDVRLTLPPVGCVKNLPGFAGSSSSRCALPGAPIKRGGSFEPPHDNPGNVLLSHTLTRVVPSALEGLTAEFGMGSGVTPPLWSPEIHCLCYQEESSTPCGLVRTLIDAPVSVSINILVKSHDLLVPLD
jgi:hypothetical protein